MKQLFIVLANGNAGEGGTTCEQRTLAIMAEDAAQAEGKAREWEYPNRGLTYEYEVAQVNPTELAEEEKTLFYHKLY